MKVLTITLCAAASLPCWSQAPQRSITQTIAGARRSPLPPVLRPLEPPESGTLVLPGAKPAVVPAPPPKPRAPEAVLPGLDRQFSADRKFSAPSLPDAPAVDSAAAAALPRLFRSNAPPPFSQTHSPEPAFDSESAIFLQKRIGQWVIADAQTVLGDPVRQRAALDDNGVENGHIFTFQDPTRLFRELELDFDGPTGKLRTVFVYPWSMSWRECRRQFGANVSATQANKGRTFYSYLNRRLDVLVAPGGNVISLGLY